MGKLLTDERLAGEAGYFRIGNLVLDIPPEQIQCHKVINNDEVLPLRFPFAIPVKTGQSRWDVTWTWKAIINIEDADPYKAWKDVRKLLAMFKAAPFVEVENEHIRQIVNPAGLTPGATADDVMAFALRQMRVDTMPDMTDTLQITMTMLLFNYRPYTFNFLYDSGKNTPVSSALNSPEFEAYLQSWITANLDQDPTQQPATGDSVSEYSWQTLVPGSLTLSCREYIALGLPHSLPPPRGTTDTTPANPGATQPGSQGQGTNLGNTPSGLVDNEFINPTDVNDPRLQWWIVGTEAGEGAGYLVKNSYPDPTTGKTSSAFGILQWTKAGAIDALKYSDQYFGTGYISTAQQSGFLLTSNASPSGVTWSRALPVGNPLSNDPATATYWGWMSNPPVAGGTTQMQNNMAQAWAFFLLTKYNGSVLKAWEAHRLGPGKVGPQVDTTFDPKWFNRAVTAYRQASGNQNAFLPTQDTVNSQGAPQANPPSTAVTSGTDSNQKLVLSNSNNPPESVPMTWMIRHFLDDGYTYDYATEVAAFLYKEHWLHLADQDSIHGDTPNSSDIDKIDPNHFLYPQQISIIFMNNIAQLPLSGYQYPTYQHLGPVSTLVSIGLLSVADIKEAADIFTEPDHTGLSLLSNMTSLLEEQFQRLRNEWRRVNSLHRMQTVAVKNQVLNMLGIRGLLTKELTTETIQESSNMVQAQYNAVQYENIYLEDGPKPFRVTVVPQQVSTEWLKVMRDGSLDVFNGDQSVKTLTQLSFLMRNETTPDAQNLIFNWMTAQPTTIDQLTSTNPAPPDDTFLVPTPSAFTSTEQSLMRKIVTEHGPASPNRSSSANGIASLLGANPGFAPSFEDKFPESANRILQHSQLNYSDFFLIRDWVADNPSLPDALSFANIAIPLQDRIDKAAAAAGTIPPLDQLFNQYFDYAVTNNVLNIRDQMVRALNTPQLQNRFTTLSSIQQSPSADNREHGCYRDIGLLDMDSGGKDNTPARYFYDDNRAVNDVLQGQLEKAVKTTVQTTKLFANATPYSDPAKLIVNSTENFSGNVSAIIQNTKPTQYTMAHAFPTFKLFLMEDRSDRSFYAYDNFYSYASVLDMEIIRYRDKPDTAVIQISNMLHLLDQHLYDSTPQGRFEKRLRANQEVALPSGTALAANGGVGGVQVNDSPSGDIFTLDNRFNEIGASNSNSDFKFPLKYFALQTGTKIQIRMGFSNDPDKLVPVFTGQVTQLEGNEILTITAQSYMLELVQPTSDEIRHDGFAVDSFLNNTANAVFKSVRDVEHGNILTVPTSLFSVFNNAAAYGGWSPVGGITISGLLTSGGGALDVISAMLRVSSAKHFGRWQLGAPVDPYLKGFSWKNAAASVLLAASNSPLTRGATGLEAGYDRSFENILTTHVFGPDGTITDDTSGSARGWWYEKPGGYGAPEYHVPKDPNLTPWTLIQDIARRFPEFILAVKQYGFPYTADATLVFGNPHDLYASRAPLPGEAEVKQQAAVDQQTFFEWWTRGTASGMQQFKAFCQTLGGQWANIVLKKYDESINFKGDSAVGILGQVGTAIGQLNLGAAFGGASLRDITAQQLTDHITSGGAPVFFNITDLFIKIIGSGLSQVLYGSSSIGHSVSPIQAQQNLNQIVQNYYNFINQKQTGSITTKIALNARMKPIRRYHFINTENIVHNGLVVNEKFYNTVRIGTSQIKANAGIPPQYCRVLNADPFVVSLDNIKGYPEISNAYIQTFLRDEVSKVYRGEIVLLGNPEIEPFDVLIMLDPSTGISGPIEVDSVIHSFNMEVGYITIVKPRGLIVLNDKLQAPVYKAVWSMLTDMQGIVEGVASKLPFAINAPTAEIALGVAATAGAIAAGPWIAGAAALGTTMGIFWTGRQIQQINPLGFIPLTRFERPMVGGLEGWRIDDLLGFLQTKWDYFKSQEIEPLLFSYRTARGMQLI